MVCERCKVMNRIGKVRIVTISALIDDKLFSVPHPVCFNEVCLAERGGTSVENNRGHFKGRPRVGA